MNRILLVMLFLIVNTSSMQAGILKVFIAVGDEQTSSVPVNGKINWSAYIGSSKLAFAIGYTYKVKIEFTSGSAGVLNSSSLNAVISDIVKTGDTYDFKLKITEAATRLSTFKIGLNALNQGSSLTPDLISCEIVSIGSFYSIIINDSSSTTRYTRGTQNSEVLKITWKKGTGPKLIKFGGGSFEHVKFLPVNALIDVGGISVDRPAFIHGDISNFYFTVNATTISSTPVSIREGLLSKLFDEAVDKPFPWVSYKYAKMQTMSGYPNQGLNVNDRTIEHIYGLIYTLNKYEEGFNFFLDSKYVVD